MHPTVSEALASTLKGVQILNLDEIVKVVDTEAFNFGVKAHGTPLAEAKPGLAENINDLIFGERDVPMIIYTQAGGATGLVAQHLNYTGIPCLDSTEVDELGFKPNEAWLTFAGPAVVCPNGEDNEAYENRMRAMLTAHGSVELDIPMPGRKPLPHGLVHARFGTSKQAHDVLTYTTPVVTGGALQPNISYRLPSNNKDTVDSLKIDLWLPDDVSKAVQSHGDAVTTHGCLVAAMLREGGKGIALANMLEATGAGVRRGGRVLALTLSSVHAPPELLKLTDKVGGIRTNVGTFLFRPPAGGGAFAARLPHMQDAVRVSGLPTGAKRDEVMEAAVAALQARHVRLHCVDGKHWRREDVAHAAMIFPASRQAATGVFQFFDSPELRGILKELHVQRLPAARSAAESSAGRAARGMTLADERASYAEMVRAGGTGTLGQHHRQMQQRQQQPGSVDGAVAAVLKEVKGAVAEAKGAAIAAGAAAAKAMEACVDVQQQQQQHAAATAARLEKLDRCTTAACEAAAQLSEHVESTLNRVEELEEGAQVLREQVGAASAAAAAAKDEAAAAGAAAAAAKSTAEDALARASVFLARLNKKGGAGLGGKRLADDLDKENTAKHPNTADAMDA